MGQEWKRGRTYITDPSRGWASDRGAVPSNLGPSALDSLLMPSPSHVTSNPQCPLSQQAGYVTSHQVQSNTLNGLHLPAIQLAS